MGVVAQRSGCHSPTAAACTGSGENGVLIGDCQILTFPRRPFLSHNLLRSVQLSLQKHSPKTLGLERPWGRAVLRSPRSEVWALSGGSPP